MKGKQSISEIRQLQKMAGILGAKIKPGVINENESDSIDQSKTIYTVIPFFSSDEVEINQNDVMSFLLYENARQYAQNLKSRYEIVENNLK